jgi:DNA-binding PadR family transcriptional regulator
MGSVRADVAAIERQILSLRGQRVLLAPDLAALYGVTPSALLQAVKRNRQRFPSDFMFQLSNQEVSNLKSQSVISSLASEHGGRRHHPYAFTEQGVAMLSTVLRSRAAIAVNIEIMRVFVRLRRATVVSEKLIGVVAELAQRVDIHDAAIRELIQTIRRLVEPGSGPTKQPIGFVPIS